MTKIESLVAAHPKYAVLGDAGDRNAKQKILDEITDEVLSAVSPADVGLHVQEVYDATISEYVTNPHTQSVIDELIVFMSMLPQNSEVLDIGCGPGRDALFMSVKDEAFRRGQMRRMSNGETTFEKFPVPTRTFFVTAIDSSRKMLEIAGARKKELKEGGLLQPSEDYPVFVRKNMHAMRFSGLWAFDGIWSCAALFTHTPRALIHQAMSSVAEMLASGGLLFLSYTNGRADGRYDKLLLSSTGRIKYFSQPDPDEITRAARACALGLVSESFSDFEVQGKVLKKGLFVSQFFRKK